MQEDGVVLRFDISRASASSASPSQEKPSRVAPTQPLRRGRSAKPVPAAAAEATPSPPLPSEDATIDMVAEVGILRRDLKFGRTSLREGAVSFLMTLVMCGACGITRLPCKAAPLPETLTLPTSKARLTVMSALDSLHVQMCLQQSVVSFGRLNMLHEAGGASLDKHVALPC